MTGKNSSPHAVWNIGGSGSMCSVTQTASHDQMVRFHSSPSSPRTMALEFSVTGVSVLSGVTVTSVTTL